MNLFVKLSNFNFVFGLSLDCFHRSRLSERQEQKEKKIGQGFGHLAEKIYSFFQKAFLRFAYFIVDIYAMPFQGMCHQDLEAVGQQAHTIAQTI
jgi:hypothetical protein